MSHAGHGCTHPHHHVHDAGAYLEAVKAAGYTTPTPEQLALAWNRGYEGAKSWNFAPNDYAIRVGNLFRLSQRGK